MKNLFIKKIIVVPYTLVCFSICGNVIGANSVDNLEIMGGFYTSNIDIEKNKGNLLEKPKLKQKRKKYF